LIHEDWVVAVLVEQASVVEERQLMFQAASAQRAEEVVVKDLGSEAPGKKAKPRSPIVDKILTCVTG
jgi:hypothetical protein